MSRDYKTAHLKRIKTIAAYDGMSLLYDKAEIKEYKGVGESFENQKETICRHGEELFCALTEKFNKIVEGLKAHKNANGLYPYAYNKAMWGDHKGLYTAVCNDKKKNEQLEKKIAKGFFNLCRNDLQDTTLADDILYKEKGFRDWLIYKMGKVLDYEVPLFREGQSNIDLVSRHRTQGIRLLELKKNHSKETLARCLLEVFSYACFLDVARIGEAFGRTKECSKITICPMIFSDSPAFVELRHSIKDKESGLRKFIEKIREVRLDTGDRLDVKFVVIDSQKLISKVRDEANLFKDAKGNSFDCRWLD